MKKKTIAIWAVVLGVAVGTAFGVHTAWPGDEVNAHGDPEGPTSGMLVPQTGGELPTVSDMVIEGEYEGLLPDEVLYVDDEPKYDVTSREPQELPELQDCIGIEEETVLGSEMMVPGFEGEVADMVV